MTDNHDPRSGVELASALGLRTRPGGDLHWRPTFYRPTDRLDRSALVELLAEPGLEVMDTLDMQLGDLLKVRHPTERLSPADVSRLSETHRKAVPLHLYGVWVHYPWSRRLVHALDEQEFVELRTARNRFKITEAEQLILAGKRVGVVGLSVGQSVALTLALERSAGELRLADFDVLDLSNLNRIRTGVHNIGVPKVVATAREIAEIDPFLKVVVFSEGITRQNLDAFICHEGRLDVVVEECDSLDIKVLVRDACRRHRVPVVMDTSDGGMLDVERFDLEPTRPLFHGLVGDLDPSGLAGLTTEAKLPYVLDIIGTQTMTQRLRASLVEVEQTIATWPQLGSEVVHGGATAAYTVRRMLLGQFTASGRFFFDLVAPTSTQNTTPPAVDLPRSASAIAPKARRAAPTELTSRLVDHAVLAPSGGNSQPWQWTAEHDDLHLCLDRTRSSGLIDFEFAGSYLALGAAAESLVLAAHAFGASIAVHVNEVAQPDHVASFRLIASSRRHDRELSVFDDLFVYLDQRRTSRARGTRQPARVADLSALTAAAQSINGVSVRWIVDDADVSSLAQLVSAADRLRMLHPQYHVEMYRELRWSREEAEQTRDGIDIDSLELSGSEMAGLHLCRDPETMSLLRMWNAGRNLQKSAIRAIGAAPAVGLLTVDGTGPVDYFNAGRAMQRMWLTATQRNVAIHPMTALPYMLARLLRGRPAELEHSMAQDLSQLRRPFRALFPTPDDHGEALLFRLTYAAPCSVKSLRRLSADVLKRIS